MKLVTCGLADLRPIGLVIQVTILAYAAIELGVGRDILNIGNRPVPHDANAILDVLLMARVAINFIVRALFPGLPRSGHQVT